MRISIITLFPEVFSNFLTHSIIKRAQEKGLIEIRLINHRDFGEGKHKTVDDKPYGGGAGMILKVDVLAHAIESSKTHEDGEKVILLDPQGIPFHQSVAENLSKLSHLILVCGHYEGVDERVREMVDMEISLGDFVLTGGEIPAMAIVDSVVRLVKGVLKDKSATHLESHSLIDGTRILEGPQYTRPEEFEGIKVPEVLLSGNPKKIETYKKEEALKKTEKRRPDLLRGK